ncbi:MAG TPA: aminotransferase class I/II-fold pyridoxal phosphate-dependent enzyme, partial [Myxococcaceae bacterium]|nr:aminotransferase class I/II-fold pyridoxal phosphate-dependent enzyme [Myxococcaceae bacterium]
GELVSLCQRYGAALLVDEAHAIGVVGSEGRGLCDELGVSSWIDIRVGTLGKALGAFGAFAMTSRPLVDWLLNRARSLVFSTALPAMLCSAAEAGLEILQSDPALLGALRRNVARFASGLNELGIPAQPDSAIFPVVLGDAQRAMRAARGLRDQGLLVKAIRPPTVPEGKSRLRFCISAAHRQAQIDHALQALRAELRQ